MNQDWTPVILRKAAPKQPLVVKGSTIKSHPNTQQKVITKETDDVTPPKTFTKEFGLKVQQARAIKKLTQKELAIKINKQVALINDIERGIAIYDGIIVDKLNRILELKKDS